jgi:hypothetical protein
MVEGEDRAMVDREPSEGARQCVAARERGTGLEPAVDDPVGLDQVAPPGAGRRRFVGDPDQPDPGVTPQGMTGGMDEHRPQPRLEGQRVAKPRQVPPDHHERLLHDVVGIDPVASLLSPRHADIRCRVPSTRSRCEEDRDMDDDAYWRRFHAYVRRRAGARGILIIGPVAIVFFVLWVFFPTVTYAPDDVRGQLPWRLLVGGGFFAFDAALVAYATRWLLADRRGEKRPDAGRPN